MKTHSRATGRTVPSSAPQSQIHNAPRAKKSLGQNFLHDANIARKIVGALGIEPGDSVLEIGPGPGALSVHLQTSAAGRCFLVEKDNYWANFHAEKNNSTVFTSCEEAVSAINAGQAHAVLEGDALQVPWALFTGPWKMIGNLPYNVASPIMWDLFSRVPQLQRAVFMIQKEVGERLAAQPSTSHYGALSVWVQTFVQPRIEFIVPPQVFNPRPKVHSAVVSFTPRTTIHEKGNYAALAAVVKRCFQNRRKQLGTILKGQQAALDMLQSRGITLDARPENLTPEDFHFLAQTTIFP